MKEYLIATALLVAGAAIGYTAKTVQDSIENRLDVPAKTQNVPYKRTDSEIYRA